MAPMRCSSPANKADESTVMSHDPPQLPSQPLKGKRIAVTRARSQASSLVAALTELGAEVIELPTIETVPLESYDALDYALKNIALYKWLVVTSANTVRVLAERLAALNLPSSTLAAPRKVAIGSATAGAMRELGIEVDIVPERYVAESLVAAMEAFVPSGARHPENQDEEESLRTSKRSEPAKSLPESFRHLSTAIAGTRILLVRAAVARDIIPDELRSRGAVIDVVEAYRTVIPDGALDQVREVFSDSSRLPDAVTFTSSSTVKNFFALYRDAGFLEVPARVFALSIGPITSETLREFGWDPVAEARRHDVNGLREALVLSFAG
jgi:uroporphyrinogen-III synthase